MSEAVGREGFQDAAEVGKEGLQDAAAAGKKGLQVRGSGEGWATAL